MIWGSGGSKSRLAKAAGREPAGQMRDEKLHAVVAQRTFASQNEQYTPFSDHFWQLRCRKSARRCGAKHICKSKCANTPGADNFWQLTCRKSARRCGAKHISKSQCAKHTTSGQLLAVDMSKKCTPLWHEAHFEVTMYKTHHVRTTLEVPMWKKCTPLWREAHFEVNMYNTPQVRATFGSSDVEKVHTVVARSTFRSQNVKNTRGSDHFWRFRCRKSARRCGAKHISKSKC